MGDVASLLRFLIVSAAVLSLDLASKAWVFANLGADEEREAIPHILHFRRSLNDGAVFGSFTGYVAVFIIASVLALGFVLYLFANISRMQRSLHIGLALILAGALGNLYDRAFKVADIVTVRTARGDGMSIIGVLQHASAADEVRIGDWPEGTNVQTFQRRDVQIRRQGVVRDFLKFVPAFPKFVPRLGGREIWPWVFNVADASLVCGVGLLLISGRRDRTRTRTVVANADQRAS